MQKWSPGREEDVDDRVSYIKNGTTIPKNYSMYGSNQRELEELIGRQSFLEEEQLQNDGS
jgi:hypothetical protein